MFIVSMQAGNYARDDVVSSLVQLIAQNPDLHGYATLHLFNALCEAMTQQPLVQVGALTSIHLMHVEPNSSWGFSGESQICPGVLHCR